MIARTFADGICPFRSHDSRRELSILGLSLSWVESEEKDGGDEAEVVTQVMASPGEIR